MKKLFLIFLTTILISACGTAQAPKHHEPLSNFYGETWQLHGFQVTDKDIEMTTQVDSAQPFTIVFKNDGSVAGKAHCNSFFGRYAFEGDRISIFDIGSTKMYCGDNSRDQDFLRGLERATTIEIFRTDAMTPGTYRLLLHAPENRALVFLKEGL
ncbi:MAG TPA: META domain-containing protein [Patescibacteria group bacterium]|nr:META domain-containing protein [Patescibacteria group bacterium]